MLYSRPTGVFFVVPHGLIRFGEFSLDCDRYELLYADRPVKLEKNPMELLILLVSKDGNLVTRQEIIKHLWGDDVFVDTEHGINTAVRKIRQALKDDPDKPRFVQTVTGKGYRFVFVGERTNGGPAGAPILAEKTTPEAAAPDPPVIARRRRKQWQVAGLAATALFLISGASLAFNVAGERDRLFVSSHIPPIHSVAVLPLVNLSGDPSQDYYADGMTDEVITMLAKNSSLRVVSRTSIMQYKGVNRPVRDIAKELGVEGILEGSLERSGNHLHMTVQLIYAPTDAHIWAESYDRDLNQAYALPTEVSQTIAKQVKAPGGVRQTNRPINPAARDAYLRGRFAWFHGDMPHAQQYFEQALQLQPDYAAAWSGLADAYTERAVDGICPAVEVKEKAEEAARKAVELDSSVSEAHKALAAVHLFFGWDWNQADGELRRAIELDPSNAEAHHLYSYALTVNQRLDDALQEQMRSLELDPFARSWALGRTYIGRRDYDAAIKDLSSRTELQATEPGLHFMMSDARWLKGQWNESEQELEKGLQLSGRANVAAALHKAYRDGGEKAVEQWKVHEIRDRARKRYVSPLDVAEQYAHLGMKLETLTFLEEAYRQRSPWLIFLQNEPVYDFLHSDPRYQAIVREIGLPSAK